MPLRQPSDGPIAVNRPGPEQIAIDVTNAGETARIVMSEFNAWRLFGMLALMLEIPLPSTIGKAIKL